MTDDIISEEGRRTRFERWEQLGLDQVKADLQSGGYRVVGGPPAVRALAWEWVQLKEAEQAAAVSQPKPAEILTLKPNFHGIGIDLNELGRRARRLFQGKDK
jgi:hypothetical protein